MTRSNKYIVSLLAAALALVASPAVYAAARNPVTDAFTRSRSLEAAGKHAAAHAALDGAIRKLPQHYLLRLRRGWLAYRAGKHRVAITDYRRAARLAPRAIEPKLGMMLPQMALRRFKDALATGRRVLTAASGNYLAASRVAWCLYNLGRFTEAERAYARVLEQYPGDLQMRAGIGWSRLGRGQRAAALRVFAQVLAISPRHPSATRGQRAAKAKARTGAAGRYAYRR